MTSRATKEIIVIQCVTGRAQYAEEVPGFGAREHETPGNHSTVRLGKPGLKLARIFSEGQASQNVTREEINRLRASVFRTFLETGLVPACV